MIKSAKTLAARFWKDESGATLIEYTILISLITVALVGTIGLVAGDLGARWVELRDALGVAAPAG